MVRDGGRVGSIWMLGSMRRLRQPSHPIGHIVVSRDLVPAHVRYADNTETVRNHEAATKPSSMTRRLTFLRVRFKHIEQEPVRRQAGVSINDDHLRPHDLQNV